MVFLDHKPLSIQIEGLPIQNQRPWRFEQVWLKEESCHTIVAAAWVNPIFSSSLMSMIEANVKNCQTKLQQWSKESFGNITRGLIEKRQQVKAVEEEAVRSGCTN